eukprot:g388.t1
MEILVKKGANVNAIDNISGGTLLHQFVTGTSIIGTTENQWNLETIPKLSKWIKEYNFDVNVKDFKGQTPYSIGRRNKLVETCKLLKSELSCEDIDDSVDDPLETLRDAINKVNAGELSIDDLGLNMAQFQEAKRLVNSHR